MNVLMRLISLLALAATIIPCMLYFAALIDLVAVQWAAFVGTLAWFITAPLWMGRPKNQNENQNKSKNKNSPAEVAISKEVQL